MEVEEWLDDNTLSIDIFNKKYRNDGESLEAWFDRVSGGDEEVKELIREKKFLFGGRVLAGRGLDSDRKSTLANCYVIPVEDSIEEIFLCAGRTARTYSYGGGVGINLSNLSPAGAKVNNAAKYTSGALSFAELFDKTTSLIGQNGRRGALMLSLRSEHPDLEEFITIKSDLNKLTKANISVMASDEFMQAAIRRDDYELSYTRLTGEIINKTVNAGEIFDKLVENNWNFAEPGLLFWDEIEGYNMLSNHPNFKFEGINPCGELPLPAFGACCLGSFNLAAYVYEDFGRTFFNFSEFILDIPTVIRAMNDVMDEGLELHPLPEQRETVANWRQIGVGVFGFASACMLMGIEYGSEESIVLADVLGETLLNESVIASAELARDFGPYPEYSYDSIFMSDFYQDNLSAAAKNHVRRFGLRNSQLLSIAPTGTISSLYGVSGGIEPLFRTSYTRRTESLHGQSTSYKIYDPVVKEILDKMGIAPNEDNLPEYIVTAADISPESRVKMQATWQKHIDASISSTVNLPNSATTEDIKNIYFEAWKQGLKGITVYRDGCSREGILTTGEKKEDVSQEKLERGVWKKKAPDTMYDAIKVYTACGKLTIMAGYSPSEKALQDLYVIRSGKGGCERTIQDLVIAMSAVIRLGGKLENLELAFEGVGTCNSFTSVRTKQLKTLSSGNNCGEAILKAIRTFCQRMQDADIIIVPEDVEKVYEVIDHMDPMVNYEKCPECKSPMFPEGGCHTCRACGYSRCG